MTTPTRRPLRFDRSSMPAAVVRRDNGWLQAPARLTRCGVFDYVKADGSIRRELRLPDEVFKADSLRSFALVPITDEHPNEPEGLTAANATKYTRGAVGENVRQDTDAPDYVAASLLITDAALVAKVDAGKVELSCGYFCDLDEAPGEHPTFGRYDAIQRNIVGNHVAIVGKGRAGPGACVKLDSADAVMVSSNAQSGETVKSPPAHEGNDMKKIVIDGIEYEVTEQVSQVLARKFAADAQALEATRGDVAKAKAEADKQTARADAAEAKATAADKARTDAADPARFNAAVAERVELIAKAREIVGTDFKADGLDARAIKVAVITKTDAAFKADGKSDDYIAARYDVAITAKPAEPAPTTTRTDAAAPGAPVDLAARKAKFDAAVKSAHETKAQ